MSLTLPTGADAQATGMTARHLSESVEHYTPPEFVEAAREAMGGIDLDPAASLESNAWIKPARFFTKEDNGFRQTWQGRVFLNPPGGQSDELEQTVKPNCRMTGECGLPAGTLKAGTTKTNPGHAHHGTESNQKKWWFQLSRQWESGSVTSGVFVMFSVELLQTTQTASPIDRNTGAVLPIPLDFAISFPKKRITFHKPGGKVGTQPPHASGIVLLSSDKDVTRRFVRAFEKFGRVALGPVALSAFAC
jgi:hypothetical protein